MKKIKDFMTKNYDRVSYRFTSKNWTNDYLQSKEDIYKHSIFAGSFAIKDCKIISLDGDTYSGNEEVLWSEEWNNEETGIKSGLTLLVQADWNDVDNGGGKYDK